MEYQAEAYGSLCSLSIFIINGIDADKEDFVDQYDHDQDNAEDYGCGDMRAEAIPATKAILDKYNISIDEYNIIADDISDKLSFGSCGWCI